jgi:K+-transporting ATPase ATPase B chain
VMVGAAFTTVLWIHAAVTGHGEAAPSFILAVSLWLWFTVLFANLRKRWRKDAARPRRKRCERRAAPYLPRD